MENVNLLWKCPDLDLYYQKGKRRIVSRALLIWNTELKEEDNKSYFWLCRSSQANGSYRMKHVFFLLHWRLRTETHFLDKISDPRWKQAFSPILASPRTIPFHSRTVIRWYHARSNVLDLPLIYFNRCALSYFIFTTVLCYHTMATEIYDYYYYYYYYFQIKHAH